MTLTLSGVTLTRQERLGMGPAEGCVGGKSWVCHVDDHVVSLALVDNTHGPLISAV